MINGIVLKKLETLDATLYELESLGQVKVETLHKDWLTRRAVERNLQVLVEIVIDVCQRIVSLAGHSPSTTGAEAVKQCVKLGALSSENPFRQMVQFRNFIVGQWDAL